MVMTKISSQEVIDQIESVINDKKGFELKKMFGGSAFLLNGHMTVGELKGHLILRLSGKDYQEVMGVSAFKPFDITGRNMEGWAMLNGELISNPDYEYWVNKAIKFVETLPAKK
jgi:TfoX/Sxy family transcriptional regulator of competence genes